MENVYSWKKTFAEQVESELQLPPSLHNHVIEEKIESCIHIPFVFCHTRPNGKWLKFVQFTLKMST